MLVISKVWSQYTLRNAFSLMNLPIHSVNFRQPHFVVPASHLRLDGQKPEKSLFGCATKMEVPPQWAICVSLSYYLLPVNENYFLFHLGWNQMSWQELPLQRSFPEHTDLVWLSLQVCCTLWLLCNPEDDYPVAWLWTHPDHCSRHPDGRHRDLGVLSTERML